MDDQIYLDMIKHQEAHWWFKARREILLRVIDSLELSTKPKILEIGSGMGGNLPMLQTYGQVSAVEIDEIAVNYTKETFQVNISQGSLPDHIDIEGKFDLICLFDVLEHVEADQLSLNRITELLAPNGILLMTVPAHQWLYGAHDQYLHHFRRYAKEELLYKLRAAQLDIKKVSYFNSLLFPLVILSRVWDLLKKAKKPTGYNMPTAFINSTLYSIFRLERMFITKMNLPIGTSMMAVAKKTT